MITEILRAIALVLGMLIVSILIGFITAKLFNYPIKKFIPFSSKKKGLPR